MRQAMLPIALLAQVIIVGSTAGCVETEDYAPCTFDPCLYAQCSVQGEQLEVADGSEIRFSCAVDHPQCPGEICLRFEGSGPFCTQLCDPLDGEAACPGVAECIEYLGEAGDRDAIHYCVPPEERRPPPPDSVGECDTL